MSVLKHEAEENRGEHARLLSFIGATAVGDLVKTTLGPKGQDKILQSMSRSSDIQVTNDGATILRSIYIDNAAAKILVDISRVQDEEVGDGTTSVCVFASELLREAERLVEKQLHPQTIIKGFRMACKAASEALQGIAVSHKEDQARLREDLLNIARTTLSSKILTHFSEHFSEMAVDAVLKLGGSTNLESIQIIKKTGGSLADSFLDRDGFILPKRIGVGQPKVMEDCRILVANTPMDNDKIKIFGAGVRVESAAKVAEIEEAEREKMTRKLEKIVAHNCNVFVNRQLIYNYPEQYFAERGVLAVEHADFAGIEHLALVTGAEIVSTFDHPELVRMGHCKRVEEVMIGEDKMVRFSGCPNAHACTIVLRGSGQQILDEAERSLHDALCVLSQTCATDTRVIYGGGNSEVTMSQAVDELAKRTEGKVALAIEAFARALRQLPTIIADNAGYDSSELVMRLRAAIAAGHASAGLDMQKGEVGDMAALGIIESFKVKHQMLISASEAAEMIIRVDDVIRCAPRKREEDHPHP